MAYVDSGGDVSRRTAWPPGLFYRGTRWSLGAWCELRRDFRNFRLDRVRELELLGDRYPVESGWTSATSCATTRAVLGREGTVPGARSRTGVLDPVLSPC